MSLKENDVWFERRAEELDELGRKKSDVMEDSKGEYVMVEGEEGFYKVYLS